MTVSRRTFASTAAATLLLAACSKASPGAAPSATPTGPKPGATVDAKDFNTKVSQAMAQVTTMAFDAELVDSEQKTTTMKGEADLSDKAKPKVKMEGQGEGKQANAVVIGDTVYRQVGGKWTKTTNSSLAKNLTKGLTASEFTFTEVVYVGPDTIDGTKVEHYQAKSTSDSHELYVNQQMQVVRMNSTKSSTGAKTNLTLSKINEPVTITEPAVS